VPKRDERPIRGSDDVVAVRQVVREWAIAAGLSLVDQTKLVTAASEIARNALVYGGGGRVLLESVEEGARRGVRLVFEDEGPGIPDIEQAMKDGFSTGSGLGLGLGGARRRGNQLSIESKPGGGTRHVRVRWR
jgi:serine/threonine-protein kinase RsbT